MPGVFLAPTADSATLRHSWIEPDGTEHHLDGTEGVAVEIASTLGAPVVEIVSAPRPFRSGARTRRANIRTRPVDLTLEVSGASASQVLQRLDALAHWLDPTRGEGRLRVRRQDGAIRDLWCRRSAGLDFDYREGVPLWQVVTVAVEAIDDPYVYDSTATVVTYTTGAPLSFFDPPFFPLKLTSSTVFVGPSDATLDNDGTAEAWPVWTITGPGTDPVVRNLTTGKAFAFAFTLTAGDQLIVDTRPVERRGVGVLPVRDRAGDNRYPSLIVRDLFPLVVGENRLQIEMANATAASEVELEYSRRWQGF